MAEMTVKAAHHRLYCVALADRYVSQSTEDNRRLWEGVVAVLNAYTSQANSNGNADPDNDRVQQFPVEVATHVSAVLGELLTGAMPADLARLKKGGASKYGPTLLDAIDTAVLYTNAARAKLIDDRTPQKTILAKFGIAKRTWMYLRKRSNPEMTDPSRWWPDADADVRAATLRNALERAAKAYRKSGRPDGGAAK